MAVVFISPKRRQKTFFIGIAAIFLLFLAIVASAVFLSQPKPVSPEVVFNKPKINIDTRAFDTDQFKNLQPFTEMKTQFVYSAKTKENEPRTGFIIAGSVREAKKILEESGLIVFELKQAEIGRDNPFTPY
ncbi:MAG: hypothetical protein ABIJ84_02420 [bacterium]